MEYTITRDRLIVATARAIDVPLLTCDARMLTYAKATRLVRVIDASK